MVDPLKACCLGLLSLAGLGILAASEPQDPKPNAGPQAAPRAAPAAAVQSVAFAPSAIESFEKDVRPLLIARCGKCHGDKAEGDLRLDSRAAVLQGGARGAAAVPGDPEASLLIKAIRYGQDDLKMPPDGKLSAAEQAVLAQWIQAKLPWPDEAPAGKRSLGGWTDASIAELRGKHWSLQAVRNPPVPVVRSESTDATRGSSSASPIDAFLMAKQQAAGLAFSPPADKRTLLRRVTYDLIGLPPTPAEIADFLADDSSADVPSADGTSAAFARAVERLLASPHYGERWGRHWLDVARYADSSGKDENHACANAFRYRDYVVRSFQADKPFDQFVMEQLAGDLMPASSDAERFDRLTATGFLQLGPKALAEQDKKKLLIDIVDEQLDAIGRGMLGLTIGCARCHDHKFDPLGMQDYYALAGILHSTKTMQDLAFVSSWLERPLANQETLDRIAAQDKALADHQKQAEMFLQQASSRTIAAWRQELGKHLLTACAAVRQGIAADAPQLKEHAVKQGANAYLVSRLVARLNAAGKDVEHPLWPLHRIASLPDASPMEERAMLLRDWSAGNRAQAAARTIAAAIKATPPESLAALVARYEARFAAVDAAWESAQRDAAKKTQLADAGDEALRQLLYGAMGLLAAAEKPNEQLLPADATAWSALEQRRLTLERHKLPVPPQAMSVAEGQIDDLPIHLRGNHLNPGPRVPRGFARLAPVANPPAIPAKQSGRLELAQWITRPDHPLTARVIVNRVWQWHFGAGLCRSPDNFGLRGQLPDHPELLDWLTHRFVRDGWSIKSLHRLILASRAYQQAGGGSGAAAAQLRDPENRLLSHFPRRRLDAEEIRDSLLAVSVQLHRAIGGSLFNYANREPHVTYYKGPVNYEFARRTIYLPVVRAAMYDALELFDHGAALATLSQRDRTTVAPQALYFMNSPLVLEAAKQLSERLWREEGTDEDRIQRAHLLLFARPASAADVARGQAFLAQVAELFADAPAAERGAKARRVLCQGWLVSNEFLYVD